jgi:hypothetical protein
MAKNKPHGDRKKECMAKISHTRQASQWQKVNKVRMKIDKRNAWQNKPHKTSKSRQKVNKVRMEIDKISHMEIEKRNAWQNKPHKTSKLMPEGEQGKDGNRQKKCMAK